MFFISEENLAEIPFPRRYSQGKNSLFNCNFGMSGMKY